MIMEQFRVAIHIKVYNKGIITDRNNENAAQKFGKRDSNVTYSNS